MNSLIPRSGDRTLVCGQTGSGKTVAMAKLAQILSDRERIAVIDTKIEPRYRRLPRASIARDYPSFWARESRTEKRNGPDIRIWRPAPEVAQDPEALDSVLYALYKDYSGPVILDELYPFHTGGRAGPGMTALLTRGRSRGITVVMGSQRPSWISRFCLSESQNFWAYTLVDRQDRRRLSEVVPNFPVDSPLDRYHFYYYSNTSDMENPMLFKPLLMRKREMAEDDRAEVETVPLTWL